MGFGFDISGEAGKSTTTRRTGNIDWEELKKILGLDVEMNRINRMGPFGGWQYDQDSNTQQWVATDPGMQAAQERMGRRLAGEGFTPYEPPSQVSSLTDALMASRMERMGILNEETRPNLAQENYGPRFGDRLGGAWGESRGHTPYDIPPPQGQEPPPQAGPPPQEPPPQQPPPQNGPPPGMRPPFNPRPVNPRNPWDKRKLR